MTGEILITATASDGTDILVFGQDEFENSAGVIIEAADDFHVGFDLIFEVERFEVIKDLVEFGEAFAEGGVVDFEISKFFDNGGARTMEVDE